MENMSSSMQEPLVLCPPKSAFQNDVMYLSNEWKFMTHRLPDKNRNVVEDVDVALQTFLRRIHHVWHRKTRGIGDAKTVESRFNGTNVRIRFRLYDNDLFVIDFDTTRLLRGIGAANDVVAEVVESVGGYESVFQAAAKIAEHLGIDTTPKQSTKKQALKKKSKPTKKTRR